MLGCVQSRRPLYLFSAKYDVGRTTEWLENSCINLTSFSESKIIHIQISNILKQKCSRIISMTSEFWNFVFKTCNQVSSFICTTHTFWFSFLFYDNFFSLADFHHLWVCVTIGTMRKSTASWKAFFRWIFHTHNYCGRVSCLHWKGQYYSGWVNIFQH